MSSQMYRQLVTRKVVTLAVWGRFLFSLCNLVYKVYKSVKKKVSLCERQNMDFEHDSTSVYDIIKRK